MSKYASKLDELNAFITEHFPNLDQQLAGTNKRKRVMILNKFCNMRMDHNTDPDIAIPRYLDYLQALAKPIISKEVQQCESAFKGELKLACMHCYRYYPRSDMRTIQRKNGPRLVCNGCLEKHHLDRAS